MAKPVAAVTDNVGRVLVICDDGSTFSAADATSAWIAANPIPGSEAHRFRDPQAWKALQRSGQL